MILFLFGTSLVGVVGTPIYIARHGITLIEILLMVAFASATAMGITVGYHRLFAHQSFKANPILQFLILFFGGAAFEQSALKWASQHRDHHLYVDTERDPYNIKQGFFHAHVGWLMFWHRNTNYDNVKDLQKSAMVVNQHRFYALWAIGAGVLLPVMLGFLSGRPGGAFILVVCLRMFFVHQSTFCINSVCHKFGKPTYDIESTAKDHWFVAMLTFGEGYHNFHHRFPSDYRNGVKWYHWDPSKWFIALSSRLGWTRDLKRVSHFRILDAKLAAENQRAQKSLKLMADHPQLDMVHGYLTEHYGQLRRRLLAWEGAAKEYQSVLYERISRHSEDIRKAALQRREAAKAHFKETREQWKTLQLQHLGVAFS